MKIELWKGCTVLFSLLELERSSVNIVWMIHVTLYAEAITGESYKKSDLEMVSVSFYSKYSANFFCDFQSYETSPSLSQSI